MPGLTLQVLNFIIVEAHLYMLYLHQEASEAAEQRSLAILFDSPVLVVFFCWSCFWHVDLHRSLVFVQPSVRTQHAASAREACGSRGPALSARLRQRLASTIAEQEAQVEAGGVLI